MGCVEWGTHGAQMPDTERPNADADPTPAALAGLPKFVLEMIGVPLFIGLFVQEWGKHERILASLISVLEGADYQTTVAELLDGQIADYGRRLKRAADAVPTGDPFRSRLQELLVEHSRLADVRRDIVHGWWSSMTPDQEFLLRRKLRGRVETSRPLAASELMLLHQALNRLNLATIEAQRTRQGLPPIDSSSAPSSEVP